MINRVLLNRLESQGYDLTREPTIGELRIWFGIAANPEIADELLIQLQDTESLTFLNDDGTIAAVIQNGIRFLAFSYMNDENELYSIEFEKSSDMEELRNRVASLEESESVTEELVNKVESSSETMEDLTNRVVALEESPGPDQSMETIVITTQAAPGTSTYFESRIKETSTVVGAPMDSESGMTVPGITVDSHDGFITITNQTGEYRTVKITLITII